MSSTKVIPEGQAAKQVAKVWAACDTASTACLDNKTAIGRQLLHSSRSVKDNIRELQEVIVESQACSHSSGAQSVSDDANSEVDLDFEADAMSPFELELAESSIPLLQVVLDVFKLLIRTLLTEDIVSEASTLDDWESLLFHAKGLSAVSNDLGAALFAPQDASEVTSAAGSLNTGCELVFDEFPGHLKDGHAEATESLIARLADAHAEYKTQAGADLFASGRRWNIGHRLRRRLRHRDGQTLQMRLEGHRPQAMPLGIDTKACKLGSFFCSPGLPVTISLHKHTQLSEAVVKATSVATLKLPPTHDASDVPLEAGATVHEAQ
ncbi:MAG: hypothetical protein FRX49_04888 [Trebouxia sp. A1-2]|nr:MAG: hypothetical protein FRX49_04888 [Trebouxia sp. A1-2]